VSCRLVSLLLVVGCGGSAGDEGASSSALTAGDPDNPSGAAIGSAILPASYAGTSTETGPGVPFDFTGTVGEPLVLDASETAAVAAARATSKARSPATQSRVDRGFAPRSVGAGSGGGK